MTLYDQWMEAKRIEAEATERRRELEDQILAEQELPECFEGTLNMHPKGYRVKIVGRINRKVDSNLIQELAVEHDMEQYLSTLLRWKPEINVAVWKHADPRVIEVFSKAVTAQPGRPSFQITKE